MVQLVKYFNENYGNEYGNIEYPRTKKKYIKHIKLLNLM